MKKRTLTIKQAAEILAAEPVPTDIHPNTLDLVATRSQIGREAEAVVDWGVAWFDGLRPREPFYTSHNVKDIHVVLGLGRGPEGPIGKVRQMLQDIIDAKKAAEEEADAED